MFAWDANPLVDPRLYNISDNRALEMVAVGAADRVELDNGRWAIQLKPTREERSSKSVGTGNLIPFGRTYNRMMEPPTINYEIPRAGDCRSSCTRRFGLRRRNLIGTGAISVLVSRTRKVSARKIDFTAIPYRSTQPTGVNTSQLNASPSSLNSIA